MNTYSIALRLRRVTVEDAYLAVPVTDAVMKQNADGRLGIDPEKLFAEGIRISQDARVEWQLEEVETEIHPIQQPAPSTRQSFDPIRTKSD